MESFQPVTQQGVGITNLFWLELAISALLMAVVVIWMVLALLRFRARPGAAAEPPQTHANRTAELIWTITPAVTLVLIFVLTIQTMRSVEAAAPGTQPVRVIGHQWWWEYEFPDQQVVTANELHVPLGTPLLLNLQSVDVIHSFHVPQFGWMRDTVPGKTNLMPITVVTPGTFEGACNQYCGLQHAWMRVIVRAEPADQFNAWVQQQRQPVVLSGARGEQVFLQNTCVNCHAIRGLPAAGRVGPDLTHLGSRGTLGTGVVDNTPDNLRRWIRNAGSIKPGVLMPAFQNLSDQDLGTLADFLETLK
ncbi:MAG: cytochrome c oxidase subunit II [Chloroflexi bacterium]|nr:cytochrome c oxidase subunit II [Chloroflexota bacterium]